MTSSDLRYFSSAEGRTLLREMEESPGDDLSRLTRFRKSYPPERCRSALTLLTLRQRAHSKFSRAAQMAFDREGLEQATGETISQYRSIRYQNYTTVADLCCGIGGDSIALAEHADVLSLDSNPDRIACMRWNVRVNDVSSQVKGICTDVSSWIPKADALFFDPSRRRNNRRIRNLRDYSPPVQLDRLRLTTPHIGIKVAPGILYSELPKDCETEFISENGFCKEAVLWFGDLQTCSTRRATLLPSAETLVHRPTEEADVHTPGSYLYEPDRAVIRAHLIDQLALDINAWKLNPQVAYLSSNSQIDTPFAKCFRIEDVIPYSVKRLQSYVNARNIGRLEIKKRRFPLEPEALRKRLKLKGDQQAIFVLTRIGSALTTIVCKEVRTV